MMSNLESYIQDAHKAEKHHWNVLRALIVTSASLLIIVLSLFFLFSIQLFLALAAIPCLIPFAVIAGVKRTKMENARKVFNKAKEAEEEKKVIKGQ